MSSDGGGINLGPIQIGGDSGFSIQNPISWASQQIGNVIGDITGTNRLADAIGSAANAQLEQQRADRQLALQLAEPSAMEIQQLEQAIATNTADIARKQKLLASSDPALIAAGEQALALLQGQEAAALDPLRRQRAEQRAQLEQTLAQRLGPDYATSSAGILALNRFDQETADLLTQAQQQTLQQLLGVARDVQSLASTTPNVNAALLTAGQRGNINARSINALLGTPVNPGLAYTGDIQRLQAQSQRLGQLYDIGLSSLTGSGDGTDDKAKKAKDLAALSSGGLPIPV